MKNGKKMIILKVLVPLLIIVGCIAIENVFSSMTGEDNKKSVVVCRDSSELQIKDEKPLEVISNKRYGEISGLIKNHGFASDNEAIVTIGDSSKSLIDGDLYKLNLSTLEKKPLNITAKSLVSREVSSTKKIAYSKEDKLHIYDLKNDSDKIIGDIVTNNTPVQFDGGKLYGVQFDGGKWSEDSNSLITREHNYKSKEYEYSIYDVEKSTQKVVKSKALNGCSSMDEGSYVDGENYYFTGTQVKNKFEYRDGIFKNNSKSGELDEVVTLPYVDNRKSTTKYRMVGPISILDKGKKILFDGIVDGKNGLFFYDTKENKFINATSTINAKGSGLETSFWVSPDKTKVIYTNTVSTAKKDLYAAKITGNTFSSKICIGKDINFSYIDMKWKDDSKTILFFTQKYKTDKQEVNLISFK